MPIKIKRRQFDAHCHARRDWLKEIARGNLANADYDPENDSPDYIHDEVYTLAFDKLHDRGIDNETARSIASELASEHANP